MKCRISFIFFRFAKPHRILADGQITGIVSLGSMLFDEKNRKLIINGKTVDLTITETRVLHIFASSPNETIERSRLQKEIWEDKGVRVGRSLDMFISKLKKKLEPEPHINIVVIRGKAISLKLALKKNLSNCYIRRQNNFTNAFKNSNIYYQNFIYRSNNIIFGKLIIRAMARRKKKDAFNKPPKRRVKVRSKAYGEHERAARGTYKEAKLNDSMKENSEWMIGSNAAARLISNALKPYRTDFKGGLFWQRLVKHFTEPAQQGKQPSVEGFQRTDINKNYPLSRIMGLSVKATVDMPALAMEVNFSFFMTRRFLQKDCTYVNGIQFTFIGLFPDFQENDIAVSSVVLPVSGVDNVETYSFILPVPATATSCMLVCKVEGCTNGQTHNNGAVSRAMAVMLTQKLM